MGGVGRRIVGRGGTSGRGGGSGPRHVALALGVLMVATLAGSPGVAAPRAGAPAAAPAAAYAPLPGATTVEGGLYASVASDGSTYYSVMRTDAGGQRIEFRTSPDNGRTWVTHNSWAGPAGGATRPVIAVQGEVVAIAYIGGYCLTGGSPCGEAAFLVRSSDSGRTFAAPLRLSGADAFTVAVGVDRGRIWVAWDGRNASNDPTVFVRRYATTGSTPQVAGNWPGVGPVTLATGGGGGVATFLSEDPRQGGARTPRAQLLNGDALGAGVDLLGDDPARPLQWLPVGAAAADGRAHLLFQDGARVVVRSAPVDAGDFGPAVEALPGTGASIAARHGLVAVAAVDAASGITYAARSSDGSGFSAPTAVALTSDRPAASAQLALAVEPEEQPAAIVTWSVAPRYTDRDADGYPDPANSGSAPPLPVPLPDGGLDVTLDATASIPGAGSSRITRCEWTIDDVTQSSTDCRLTKQLPVGRAVPVSLQVEDDAGALDRRNIEVTPRDLLVVSLGDSVASGEGNPHVDASLGASETWEDGPCHRSHFAGPALAAKRLEELDPHSSVTFVQLACSGAAMLDVPAVPGQPTAGDDPRTGGVLDGYQGVEPDGSGARPSQLSQMSALIGSRTPDSVLLSIGANDVVFSDVLKACLVSACTLDGTKATLDARLATLPDRYAALGAALEQAGVPDRAVTISQYYDVSSNDLRLADLKCVANAASAASVTNLLNVVTFGLAGTLAGAVLGDGIVTDDEAIWARDYLGRRINEEVRAGAQAQGWRTVGGFESAFARHGYCASDPWIVTVPVSLGTQHDEFGSFHPNRGGHGEYGRRLGNALLRQLIAPAPLAPEAATASSEPGDAYVVTQTAGSGELTLAAVRDEGSRMAPIGVRRLDRVSDPASSGPFVGVLGPPAADGMSAVATWYQLDDPVGSRWRSLLARTWLVENATVGQVAITQAADGATTLVAGRPAVVTARVGLAAAEPREVEITTVVTDDENNPVLGTTETVRLELGWQVLGLPRGATFEPKMGRTYSAQVTIADPPGAPAAQAADNLGVAVLDDSPTVVETRPLRLLGLPLRTSEGVVGCDDTAVVPRGMYSLRARIPVTAAEATVGCSTLGTFDTSKRGAAQALTMLDYFARITAMDSVVGVAQRGWLDRADKPGTLAIANIGGRGIVYNADTYSRVVTHEATHNLGFDHWDVPASGWDVPGGSPRSGKDYMNPYDGDHWVAGRMWDAVARSLGGPANTPRLPDPASPGVWVRGEIVPRPDGSFGVPPSRWVPAAAGQTTDPRLGGAAGAPAPAGAAAAAAASTAPPTALDLTRMTARQVASDGSTIAEQPVPVEPIGGVYQPGTTQDDEPIGWTFSGLVVPEPGAAKLELTLDGTVVDARVVNSRPTATVTAPAAGTNANRGESLAIAWEASDPDGDPLTADLLVSGDGGTTWRPLAYDVGASPATVTVPADLDGDRVKVRVVVSDGVRMGIGDSEAFTVGGVRTEVRDRVVFARDLGPSGSSKPTTAITMMDLDGGNEATVPLPTKPTWDPGVTPTDFDCRYNYPTCTVSYWFPSWSRDGSRIYFSSNLIRAGFGGAATGQRDSVPFHLWSAKPDGSDLRRITDPLFTIPQDGSGYRGSNWCPNVSSDRIAWVGDGNGTMPDAIWAANLDGSDQRAVFQARNGLVDTRDQARYPWPAFVGSGWVPSGDPSNPYLSIAVNADAVLYADGLTDSACPRFSPDGSQIALIVSATQRDGVGTGSLAVLVMDADGGNQRLVSDALEQISSVDWLDDNRLLLTKRTPSTTTWDQERYTAITLDLRTQQRTVGTSWLINDGPVSLRALGTTAFGPTANLSPYNSVRNYDLASVADFENPTSPPAKVVKDGNDKQFDGIRTTVTTGGGTPVVTFPPVTPPKLSAGGPYTTTVDAPIALAAGGTALADPLAVVAWDLDGDGAFDDAVGAAPEVARSEPGSTEVRVRVTPASGSAVTSEPTTLTVLDRPDATFDVASDASGEPSGSGRLEDLTLTIQAGVATPVRLNNGIGGPFTVLTQDTVLALGSGAGAGPASPAGSGGDGTVLVTPDAAFRGTASFTYGRLGEPGDPGTVTVEVIGNAVPKPRDDALTGDAGVRSEVDPAVLLANDADPDATPDGTPLRMVAVSGMTSGEAWLSADGDRVVVVPGLKEPSASFTYTVVDQQGATATATVRVTVRGTQTAPPPAPPPSSPPPATGEPPLRPGMAGTLTAKVYFGYKSTTLTKAQQRKLRTLVASVPAQVSVSSGVVGVVRAKGATKADFRRALTRARVVRDYLAARGLPGRIVVTNDARTRSTSPGARRVNVTIRYASIP